jgi:hypothetical protein
MTIAAFTTKAQGLLRAIYTEAGLSPADFTRAAGEAIPPPKSGSLRAIWDTGASGSVVSIEAANSVGLHAVGYTPVSTANGNYTAPIFVCDIYLPTGIVVPSVEMVGGSLGSDVDMLIGMDVITLGDFTITNLGGDTWFTFRMPSMQRADYKAIPMPNENHRCPCGTVKHYKKCCQPLAKKILAVAFK